MEKLAKCKVLIGTYINDNIILGGSHVAEFETRDNKFFIKIEQFSYRKISIKASEVSSDALIEIFRLKHQKSLLML